MLNKIKKGLKILVQPSSLKAFTVVLGLIGVNLPTEVVSSLNIALPAINDIVNLFTAEPMSQAVTVADAIHTASAGAIAGVLGREVIRDEDK